MKIKLKIVDDELLGHFKKIDLDCFVFLQRWLKCMFNREFHPIDVLIIWDGILTNEYEEITSNQEYKSNLIMIDYICVSMLCFLRDECIF
jgi:hypothetical protein